ncbi:hypothetical protein CAEBREN_30702 [Caenorhabditis brenneri]|uniref:Uncharacterized protein n=1 Tax=Caenorhabditis brenneri TaxID=135651 RepID=G0MVH5_CAEBE|nr:hypothetical protein CAEBREN_30702 [Caenorhabditis brenneri]
MTNGFLSKLIALKRAFYLNEGEKRTNGIKYEKEITHYSNAFLCVSSAIWVNTREQKSIENFRFLVSIEKRRSDGSRVNKQNNQR